MNTKNNGRGQLRKHFITLTLTTIIVLVISIVVFSLFPSWYFKAFPLLFLIMAGTFYFVDYLFIKNVAEKGKNFIFQHKLTTTIKFFVLLFSLVIFIIIDKSYALNIAISFVALFFIYLTIQTISFLKIFKNK